MPAQYSFSNAEVASLFRKVAAAYEMKGGDFFHVRAYQNAAESIDHLGVQLSDLWQQEKLDEVAGLGESLISHLDELYRTGKVKHFQTVMKGIPMGAFSLLDLPDVGPKTALRLARLLKLNREQDAKQHLQKALIDRKINGVRGIGVKTIESLKRGLIDSKKVDVSNRLLLVDALILAQELSEFLIKIPSVKEAQPLGSLRRRAATIGDIDIGVSSDDPESVMKHLRQFRSLKRIVSMGESSATIIHVSGQQIDLKISSTQDWGSLLQHYTGSKAHNIHLRTLAKKSGLSLSEHGIKTSRGVAHFKKEEEFYKRLGLVWIPPELREDSGEIEAALSGKIPDLVVRKQIKGDLHIHTNLDWPSSHDVGTSSLSELFDAATKLDYQYIGLSDHQPKYTGLSARDRYKFIERRNQIIEWELITWRKRNSHYNLHVFKGLEVDIRPDGSLALEEESLQLLDYVIASVHSSFNQGKAEATERVITALSHPKVKIFGHPSGRMIGKRRGLEYDWQQLFATCVKKKKIIEINASPWRLDLPDVLVRIGLETGVKFIINSDAHNINHLEFMRYGVWQARRGWARATKIINTYPLSKIQKLLA